MLTNIMHDTEDAMIEPAKATLRALRRARAAMPSAVCADRDHGPRLQHRRPRDVRLQAREVEFQGDQEQQPCRAGQQQPGCRCSDRLYPLGPWLFAQDHAQRQGRADKAQHAGRGKQSDAVPKLLFVHENSSPEPKGQRDR
jgi:hypothetical protein